MLQIRTFCRAPTLLSLMAALWLAGCSTPPVQETAPQEAEPTPAAETDAETHPVRPFPPDTLYQLLVAEFAGIRSGADRALDIYVNQAFETRDPAVIDRAIRIAGFLRRDDTILELAELWIEVEPENLDVRRLLAFHLARAGRVLEAFGHSEYLLKAGDGQYLQSLAAFAEPVSGEEKARLLALYRELEEKHPANPALLLGKAMLLRQLEQPEASLAAADAVLELEPDNEHAHLLRAQLLHQTGQAAKAIKSLQRALQRSPGSKRLRLQLARLLADDNPEASRRQMQKLVDLYPDDPDLKLSLALIDKELGRQDRAAALLTELVENNQNVSDASFHLGRLAEENGHFEDALNHYSQVRRGRFVVTAAARAADLLQQNAGLAAARVYLSELRRDRPGIAPGFYRVEAELLIEEGDLDAARELLGLALENHPDDISLLYARSVVGAQQKDLTLAEADLRTILEREPDNATALNALGYTLLNLSQRYQEAFQLITRARALEPDDPAIIDSLGWAHYRLGNFDAALQYLRQAYEAFPDPEVAAHLGEVLWVTGKKDEARRIWNEALEKAPGNAIVLETRERLIPEDQ